MITAIPMNHQEIAPHFSKAISVGFFDEEGNELSREANPALNTNCSGKIAMLDLLQRHNADRVIVRHVGHKMLGRLLNSDYRVFQMKRGRNSEPSLAAIPDNELIQLNEASQGSPSPNFDKKHSRGRKCCENQGNTQSSDGANSCCSSKASGQRGQTGRHRHRNGCCH